MRSTDEAQSVARPGDPRTDATADVEELSQTEDPVQEAGPAPRSRRINSTTCRWFVVIVVLATVLTAAAFRTSPQERSRRFVPAGSMIAAALGGPEGYSLDDFAVGVFDDRQTETAADVPRLDVPRLQENPEPMPRAPRRNPRAVRYTTHRVQRGESLWMIAQRFDTDWRTILSVNSLTNSRLIRPGQELRIPNRKGLLHRVRRNDTLEDIALRYDVSIAKIVEANGVDDPNRIRVGQELFIPGAKVPKPSAPSRNAPRRRSPKFIFPAKGRLSSGYGMRRHPISGRRQLHRGIDVAAPTGTPIVAARAGRVTYAGWLGGYGRLIVIDHGDGYTTRYAHTSRLYVRKNERVRQGEKIAAVGSSGYTTGPHLHFEVRYRGEAVDPARILPKR